MTSLSDVNARLQESISRLAKLRDQLASAQNEAAIATKQVGNIEADIAKQTSTIEALRAEADGVFAKLLGSSTEPAEPAEPVDLAEDTPQWLANGASSTDQATF